MNKHSKRRKWVMKKFHVNKQIINGFVAVYFTPFTLLFIYCKYCLKLNWSQDTHTALHRVKRLSSSYIVIHTVCATYVSSHWCQNFNTCNESGFVSMFGWGSEFRCPLFNILDSHFVKCLLRSQSFYRLYLKMSSSVLLRPSKQISGQHLKIGPENFFHTFSLF
jgi:hypothetical protein